MEGLDDRQVDDKEATWPIVVTVCAVVAIWFVLGLLPSVAQYAFPLTWGTENAGTFGDSFGFVNSLFSGLAFAFVVLALHYQRKELALQREELQETRKELKRSADSQHKSQAALNLQSYLHVCNTLAQGWAAEEESLLPESTIKFPTHQRKLTLLQLQYLFDQLRSGTTVDASDLDISSAVRRRFVAIGRAGQSLLESGWNPSISQLQEIVKELRREIEWLGRIVHPSPESETANNYVLSLPRIGGQPGLTPEVAKVGVLEFCLTLIRENEVTN